MVQHLPLGLWKSVVHKIHLNIINSQPPVDKTGVHYIGTANVLTNQMQSHSNASQWATQPVTYKWHVLCFVILLKISLSHFIIRRRHPLTHVKKFPSNLFSSYTYTRAEQRHHCLILINPQPHRYRVGTLSCQASGFLFYCFESRCHKVWRHSSTDQWTRGCTQQALTWSETGVSAQPLPVIVKLTASWTLHDSHGDIETSYSKSVHAFTITLKTFVPLAHSPSSRRHVLLLRHRTTDAGKGLSQFYRRRRNRFLFDSSALCTVTSTHCQNRQRIAKHIEWL